MGSLFNNLVQPMTDQINKGGAPFGNQNAAGPRHATTRMRDSFNRACASTGRDIRITKRHDLKRNKEYLAKLEEKYDGNQLNEAQVVALHKLKVRIEIEEQNQEYYETTPAIELGLDAGTNACMHKAASGDTASLILALDRMFGRPMQQLAISGLDGEEQDTHWTLEFIKPDLKIEDK